MNRFFSIKNGVLLLVVLLMSCSTTRKKAEDIGYLGRKYHDMTSKYNGYFNASELYDESKMKLEEAHTDNYNKLLDIYKYSSSDDPTVVQADMDKAIDKVTKVAGIHHVSQWVDDCYVLLGRAQYLKGDYESAQETFEYFLEDFNPKDPDSRVYIGQNKSGKKSDKAKKKERKAKEKERDEKKKQRERERKEEQKRRKKNKGKRSSKKKKTEEKPIEGIASADNAPLSADEKYLREAANKKKENKEESEAFKTGFLKHRPAYYEGMIELARTYVKREKWLDAKYYLDKVDNDGHATKEQLQESAVVRADLMMQSKDYEAAIPALINAIEVTKDKRLKARMSYILGQLHQMKGHSADASKAYAAVEKYKAPYEMKLNAQLAQMRNDWASGGMSSSKIIGELEGLLKQNKNASYKGAIYFTLAEIYLADGNNDAAMEQFALALEHSPGGNKSEIFYRLGTLFDGKGDYISAKNYMDSTLMTMNKKDDRYLAVKSRAARLAEVATHLSAVQKQDSLIKLSQLSDDELEAYAMKIIKDRESQAQEELEGTEDQIKTTQTLTAGNSRFFAYNPTALQKGKRDFRKRWGDRPLEDNWRRINKSLSGFEGDETDESGAEEVAVERDYSNEVREILKDVPTTAEKLEYAKRKRETSLFKLGTSYRTAIENPERSAEALEELLRSYPDTEYKAEAYYFQYLNYTDLGNSAKAQQYLDKLRREFPKSPFTEYLNDPTNSNALMTEEKKIEVYYDNTYQEFTNGNYKVVIDRIGNAEKDFGEKHHMKAKYDLLKAMATGNVAGEAEYINALRGVILKHNNTPEQVRAREMLRFLRGDEEAFGDAPSEEDVSKFKVADTKLHYVIVLIYGGDGNAINQAKGSISQFNDKNFKDWRLRSTSMYLNPEKKVHLALIRRFKNKTQAMEYYEKYTSAPKSFLDTEDYSYEVFAINQLNYREVISAKSISGYRPFFEKHYLGKEE